MSDSVDRVFVHALNTVKKIPRTGSARPPPADRLKLYGLYKQSMEGDVEGVMDRPTGTTSEVLAECEKWDAWHAQRTLSRTEAKRRYITTLIATMHKYASPTPEARELVSELEFVWDQIKSNPSSSSSSSPLQTSRVAVPPGLQQQPSYASIGGGGNDGSGRDRAAATGNGNGERLRMLSPISQRDAEELDKELEDDAEFQEARDNAYDDDDPGNHRRAGDRGIENESRNRKWRRRVEQALTKMTAEVAALREQMESRRIYGMRRRSSLWAWMKWLVWVAIRQVVLDAILVGCALLWMRVKGDRRLEGRLWRAWDRIRSRLERVRWRQLVTFDSISK